MKAQFEKVSASSASSFSIFKYELAAFDAPWHYHPEYELTLILNSQGMRYVGDSVQRFLSGDLVLIGSNLPHCWQNSGVYEGNAKSIVIQFDKEHIGNTILYKKELHHIHHLLELSSHGLHLSEKAVQKIQPLMEQMLSENEFERYLILLQILNIMAQSEYKVLSESSYAYQLNHRASQRVNDIYAYVTAYYQSKINLSDMAEHIAMSEEAFCRFCKKTLKKPFFVFLNEYRINKACELLVDSDLSISQVAYECGYESLPFFYRQFQKFTNHSPSRYRKFYRKELA
ncbi:AraC family transcriptional regulator [Porifericola rhodea]|uniref:AraC family transcriptional regulator n=1 Tax=Porifericola rhodea TaxID=930972 RepID=UPI002665255A|nr:AraC family transcriptional regulator [Porifericola rhodea]WKN30940.1 AraC family transcriptional regulator [Porifericola rhodea]